MVRRIFRFQEFRELYENYVSDIQIWKAPMKPSQNLYQSQREETSDKDCSLMRMAVPEADDKPHSKDSNHLGQQSSQQSLPKR